MNVIKFPGTGTFADFMKELQRANDEVGPIEAMSVMYVINRRAFTIYFNVDPKDLALHALLMQQEAIELTEEEP